MIRFFRLLFRRILILALVVWLAHFTAFILFPYIDDRMPRLAAILFAYGFVAYIGLPALVRFWQLLQRPTHVPTRTHAGDGWAVDPINIAIVAKSEKELMWAMQKAGWILADKATPKNIVRMMYAFALDQPYPSAPFGTYYVFGRGQDLGFQIPIGGSPRNRHHVRFWRVSSTTLRREHAHNGFWRKILKRFIRREREVWIGAAILDRGLTLKRRTLQIDHKIDANTAAERDFLVNSLRNAQLIKDVISIEAGEALHTRHQGFGETIISDGTLKLCELKRQVIPPIKNPASDL